MVFTLARASMDGALLVVAIWAAICLLDRVLLLSPATRAMLWWCAAAKFVVALTWTTPVTIPILPAEQPAVPLFYASDFFGAESDGALDGSLRVRHDQQ